MIEHITLCFIKIPNQFNAIMHQQLRGQLENFQGKTQELDFECLQQRRQYRKLCCLFKINSNQSPIYLFQLVPSTNTRYFARHSKIFPNFVKKHDFFKNSFFLSTIKEYLDPYIKNSKSISIFKSNILKPLCRKPNCVYYYHNPKRIRPLTRLCLGLSHLCEHKLKPSFQETVSIHFASAVMKLKHLPTTYFTVQPIQMKE